jgi:hypothetical protein
MKEYQLVEHNIYTTKGRLKNLTKFNIRLLLVALLMKKKLIKARINKGTLLVVRW